ncbi:MAG: transporter substrate-binding domain-containing protein [Rhodospirillales bacterium]|nr:transporter substrate-binding domain-containing protein [Rhodospirillales bacterium]MBO6785911.1 transporter substrate-binding domain-containing protein [Rhodospirillales bacterium]
MAISLAAATAVGAQTRAPEVRSGSLLLSAEEAAWLENNSGITVAVDNDFPPINFARAKGAPVGMALDILDLIEARSGLTFSIRTGSWNELIDDALAHRVDAIINADMTPERQRKLLFTGTYLAMPQAIVVPDTGAPLQSIDDLKGKRVALLRGTSHVDHFRERYPEIEIVLADTMLGRFDKMVTGEADAMVAALPVVNHFIQTNLLGGFEITGLYASQDLDNLRIAVRNSAPALRSILNKAIDTITPADIHRISARWLPQSVVNMAGASDVGGPELTAEERQWLRDHPVIRVAADPAWPPIEFLDSQGSYEGISVDYLSYIGKRLGVRFEYDTASSWTEAVAKLKSRELDMFSAAMETPSRREFATFTSPYIGIAQVIFSKSDAPFWRSLDDLTGERLAVVDGYAIAEILESDYPGIELIKVRDISAGLDAVRQGEVAGFVGGIMNVGYRLREAGATDIKVSGPTPYELKIAMAARSDWPILHGILEKSLKSIPAREQNRIQTSWIAQEIELPPDYSDLLRLGALVIVMILLAWILHMYIQRKSLVASQKALQTARIEAEAASRAKSEFLASMSHELRTPLNAILGFAQMLEIDAEKRLNPSQKEYVESIISGGNHLLHLVNQVLDLSKIETDHVDLDIRPVAVADIVAESIKLTQGLATTKNVHVFNNAGKAPSQQVMADPDRLKQIVVNLLSNAIKYNREGGEVVIDVETTDDGLLRLSVRDTGYGIGHDEQAQIFQLFYTGKASPHLATDGFGIGLGVSKMLVDKMNGRIGLESEPGAGSLFWVEFSSAEDADIHRIAS